MVITDTHAHLYVEAFDEDRHEMMKRALESGVKRFFLPAIESACTNRMIDLQRAYPEHVFLMMGLHPTHVNKDYKAELKHVANMLEREKCYAVGEIGIDLYWDKAYLQQQQDAFVWQIRLAKKHRLPIVIHSRASFDEIFEILEQEKGDDLHGIFHCFAGNKTQAEKAISYNMKLGIGGVLTFKNGKIDQFLHQIDLEHIVLETDAPYLAPTPFRGKRNESAYIVKVLEKLAVVYGRDQEEIAEITTNNSQNVFGV
ncbi:MAG: TatD family hydrolase [Bacteroidota bacterium]